MSLIDICYEKINERYSYGVFGDFRLIVDTQTGFFNATKLCQSGGKRFNHWLRLEGSKNLIDYLNTNLAAPDLGQLNPTYYIQPVGTNPIDLLVSGTYVSDKLILSIASWISFEFYDKCNDIIKDFYIKDFAKSYKENNESLEKKLDDIEEKLEMLCLNSVTPTNNQAKHHKFILIKFHK